MRGNKHFFLLSFLALFYGCLINVNASNKSDYYIRVFIQKLNVIKYAAVEKRHVDLITLQTQILKVKHV